MFKVPALRLTLVSTPWGTQKKEHLVDSVAETWNENVFQFAEFMKLICYV